MKNLRFLVALLPLLMACTPPLKPEAGDFLKVTVSNYSIQDAESYIYCEKSIDPQNPLHQRLVVLIGELSSKNFENEDGSDYYDIELIDKNGTNKATLIVPQGGGGVKKSKTLFSLIEEVCH